MLAQVGKREEAQLLSEIASLSEELERVKLEKHWLSDDYDRLNSERAHLARQLDEAKELIASLEAAMKDAYGGHEQHEMSGPVVGCPDCKEDPA